MPKGRRILNSSIAGSFWAVWLYLWAPLSTATAWGFGAHTFMRQMDALKGFFALEQTLIITLLAAGVPCAALIGWALYNWARFGGIERRKPQPCVDVDTLAHAHRVDATDLAVWQSAKRLVVHHDDMANVVSVDFMNTIDKSINTIKGERPIEL